jgi:hypothetical protein
VAGGAAVGESAVRFSIVTSYVASPPRFPAETTPLIPTSSPPAAAPLSTVLLDSPVGLRVSVIVFVGQIPEPGFPDPGYIYIYQQVYRIQPDSY